MNSNKLFICFVLSLFWWMHEILSVTAYENVTELLAPQYPVEVIPTPYEKAFFPTASASIASTRQDQLAQVMKPTQESRAQVAEKHAKAQVFVVDNQKLKSYENMVLKNSHTASIQNNEDHKSRSDQKDDTDDRNKQQKWQIPSPISPLATSDPKATNSSKRQIIDHNGGYALNSFVPSQELGAFEELQGFIPQQPQISITKPIQYVQPVYIHPKPLKHDGNYANVYVQSRLPAQKGMKAFESDFEDLKNKYPELNELVNNYPIMEELMKQKLSEKFEESDLGLRYHPHISIANSHESSDEKGNKYTKLSQVNLEPYKPRQETSAGLFGNPQPYAFDLQKPNWYHKKPDQDVIPSSVTPYDIPAGEIYKLPVPVFFKDDKKKIPDLKNHYFANNAPKKVGINPWKKILHMVTAFLPVGILISALTPNIVNINNTADKNFPTRQRSADGKPDEAGVMKNYFLEMLREPLEDAEFSKEDQACDERNLCLLAVRGRGPKASTMEKLLWKLANDAPETIAERVGLKRLFKAVQATNCSQLQCKKLQGHHAGEDLETSGQLLARTIAVHKKTQDKSHSDEDRKDESFENGDRNQTDIKRISLRRSTRTHSRTLI